MNSCQPKIAIKLVIFLTFIFILSNSNAQSSSELTQKLAGKWECISGPTYQAEWEFKAAGTGLYTQLAGLGPDYFFEYKILNSVLIEELKTAYREPFKNGTVNYYLINSIKNDTLTITWQYSNYTNGTKLTAEKDEKAKIYVKLK